MSPLTSRCRKSKSVRSKRCSKGIRLSNFIILLSGTSRTGRKVVLKKKTMEWTDMPSLSPRHKKLKRQLALSLTSSMRWFGERVTFERHPRSFTVPRVVYGIVSLK
ncbi:hypothetical protein J6590_014959 [Homalodisca vitripennis]|nr:hypothetical protein J6590_014959 [Homalodisca vitripennis]